MKKLNIIFGIILVLIVGTIAVLRFVEIKDDDSDSGNNIACTMDAKICPDGSAVGRVGPKCDFAECPDVVSKNTVASEDNNSLWEKRGNDWYWGGELVPKYKYKTLTVSFEKGVSERQVVAFVKDEESGEKKVLFKYDTFDGGDYRLKKIKGTGPVVDFFSGTDHDYINLDNGKHVSIRQDTDTTVEGEVVYVNDSIIEPVYSMNDCSIENITNKSVTKLPEINDLTVNDIKQGAINNPIPAGCVFFEGIGPSIYLDFAKISDDMKSVFFVMSVNSDSFNSNNIDNYKIAEPELKYNFVYNIDTNKVSQVK